jgi:hypothetical protein
LPHSYDFDLGFRLAELNPTVTIAEDAVVYAVAREPHCQWSAGELRAFLSRNPRCAAVLIGLWALSGLPAQPQELDAFALESDPSSAAWRRLIAIAPPDEVPGSFHCTIDEIVEYLSERAGARRQTVYDYVTGAVAQGLLVGERHGHYYFDLYHTLNWLTAKTLYLDEELRNSSFARTHPTPRQLNWLGAEAVSVHCSGCYTLELDPGSDFHWPGASLNIGFPVEHEFQRRVRLLRLEPPELAPYVDQRRGLIADVPIELCIGNSGSIGYEFECDVAEGYPGAADPYGPSPKPRDLRFTYSPAYLERAAEILNYILDGAQSDPESDVRRIYHWIVENIGAAPTHLPDHAVMEAGVGSCIALTRLFINLVRLRGIAAREQCGAPMSRGISTSEVLTVTLGHSPFSHTWAEVCWDGRIWRPVDFVVICYGKWMANARNVTASLRTELEGQSERLLKYYFGGLDPYRIYADPCLNRIPPFVPSGLETASRSLGEVMAHLRHRLVVSVLTESHNIEDAP